MMFALRLAASLIVTLMICSTNVATANMANPVKAGDAVGEPSGDPKQIAIVRETLSFDLRPLSTKGPAVVEALYQIDNGGSATTTNLLFVANGLSAGDENGVWLDEVAVPNSRSADERLPSSWQSPRTTPRGEGRQPLAYEVTSPGIVSFTVTIGPGAHQLRVRYLASPTAYSSDSPTIYWQLGYVLAPARQWAKFGRLVVSVKLPQDWSAYAEPAMERTGDTLHQAWDGLPADTIALTVQAPAPHSTRGFFAAAATAIGFLLCVVSGISLGGCLGRRKRSSAWALPVSVGAAILWPCLVLAGYLLPPSAKALAGIQAAWTYGYGDPLIAIILAIGAAICGFSATQLSAFISCRKSTKQQSTVG